MACQRCASNRIAEISAKCSDLCFIKIPGFKEHDGYVPNSLNIGGGDFVRLELCLDCGQVQGEFPITDSALIRPDRRGPEFTQE